METAADFLFLFFTAIALLIVCLISAYVETTILDDEFYEKLLPHVSQVNQYERDCKLEEAILKCDEVIKMASAYYGGTDEIRQLISKMQDNKKKFQNIIDSFKGFSCDISVDSSIYRAIMYETFSIYQDPENYTNYASRGLIFYKNEYYTDAISDYKSALSRLSSSSVRKYENIDYPDRFREYLKLSARFGSMIENAQRSRGDYMGDDSYGSIRFSNDEPD